MRKKPEYKGEQCNGKGCGCSASYIYLGLAAILVVMLVSTTVK